MKYYIPFFTIAVAFLFTIIFVNLENITHSVFAQGKNESKFTSNNYPVLHKIEMSVKKIAKPDGVGDLYAYQLDKHEIYDPRSNNLLHDITSKYSKGPTIPGPTFSVMEGDLVELTFVNPIQTGAPGMVGIHVHGIHYQIVSDDQSKKHNGEGEQGVPPGKSVRYHWTAGAGTAGTWSYHDTTLTTDPSGNGMSSAENVGLFGSLIINKNDTKTIALIDGKPTKLGLDNISKDILCYITDDVFWCDQIDHRNNGIRTALWENPTIGARDGDLIQFHLFGMGNDLHLFELTGYSWLDPGTPKIIQEKRFGPLESHVFTIQAKNGIAEYRDAISTHFFSGMRGDLVVDNVGQSKPGKSPLN